jgi:hypothetical protein
MTDPFDIAWPGDEINHHAQSLKHPVSEKRMRPMGSSIGVCGSPAFGKNLLVRCRTRSRELTMISEL